MTKKILIRLQRWPWHPNANSPNLCPDHFIVLPCNRWILPQWHLWIGPSTPSQTSIEQLLDWAVLQPIIPSPQFLESKLQQNFRCLRRHFQRQPILQKPFAQSWVDIQLLKWIWSMPQWFWDPYVKGEWILWKTICFCFSKEFAAFCALLQIPIKKEWEKRQSKIAQFSLFFKLLLIRSVNVIGISPEIRVFVFSLFCGFLEV